MPSNIAQFVPNLDNVIIRNSFQQQKCQVLLCHKNSFLKWNLGDFLGRHLVTCVYSLVRRQGSPLVEVSSCCGAAPLPCPLGGSPTARCRVPPHQSVTLGTLSEIRASTRLWRWTLTAAGSPYTLDQVLQCSGAHWRTGPWYSWL